MIKESLSIGKIFPNNTVAMAKKNDAGNNDEMIKERPMSLMKLLISIVGFPYFFLLLRVPGFSCLSGNVYPQYGQTILFLPRILSIFILNLLISRPQFGQMVTLDE